MNYGFRNFVEIEQWRCSVSRVHDSLNNVEVTRDPMDSLASVFSHWECEGGDLFVMLIWTGSNYSYIYISFSYSYVTLILVLIFWLENWDKSEVQILKYPNTQIKYLCHFLVLFTFKSCSHFQMIPLPSLSILYSRI